MNILMKQSTAKTIRLGPFVDATDGVTPETGLAAAMVVYVSKNNGAFAARNSATAITYDRDGFYAVELDATDTNTLGELQVEVSLPVTHGPVFRSYSVVPANVYESFYGTEFLEISPVGPDVIRSGSNINVYKRDDTTLQRSKAASFAAASGTDVITQIGS